MLIGVNLLREGLDLPEVSLVAILDADKEGFLRSHRSLTQTAGRAARNVNGKVIFYADKITDSMRLTMDETARRRENSSLIMRNMALRLSRLSKTAFPWLRRNNNRLQANRMLMWNRNPAWLQTR